MVRREGLSLKPRLWFTLYHLAKLGAYNHSVEVSSVGLTKNVKAAQQTIARHLQELEKLGFIQREVAGRGQRVRIGEAGYNALRDVYLGLKTFIESLPEFLELEGELFTGVGEGGYYVSREGYRRQFIEKLGFDPYPGTLNLRLKAVKDIYVRKSLELYPGIMVKGFKDRLRAYGPVKCYKAVVNEKVEGALLLINRTHYGVDVAEVIAPQYLRDLLKIKDGDRVKVRVYITEAAPSTSLRNNEAAP